MSATESGIPGVGTLPWGSHACHLYERDSDLTDVLVPYFRAGLERNEKCIWITAEPLPSGEARAALGRAAPDSWRPEQIEILDHRDWYDMFGSVDGDEVVEAWHGQERKALEEGYRGLRITGNAAGVVPDDRQEFGRYERTVDEAIRDRRIVAVCSYPELDCSAGVLLDAFRAHGLALTREEGSWTAREAGGGRIRDSGTADDAYRLLEELLAVLGHDLRDPLNAMTVASQVLLGSDDRRSVRIGAQIRSSAQRMSGLMDDLLDFSRERLGRGIPVEPVAMDLHRMARVVLNQLEMLHPDRTVNVRCQGPSRGEWDPYRISQVLSNLLGNALEHGEGPVELTLRREADDQVLVVRNGGSIGDAELEHIFEPFHSLDRQKGEKEGGARRSPVDAGGRGLGLGLYIVRQIVRAHGGTVEVRSSSAEGTVFTVRLPRHPEEKRFEEVQVGE